MDRPRDEGSAAVATVMATDAAGRMLHCFVEQSLRIQDQDYGLLSPVDTPAHLCRWPADPTADPELIADPHRYPQVLDELDTALQEQELCLVRSAGLLTVAGDLEDAHGEGDDLSGDDDPDTCVLLASVCHGGTDFDLYGSLDPCFLLARLGAGTAELLAPDVLAQLQPLVEEALAHGEEACP
ncbi:MAG: DUF3727 domain-containing protein [Synechococcus sp. SB0668_bin_13]|uniref:DUF3727 domain-containing protein n=1 Tax=Synechococcus sp. SB0676_bin_10 TaxID=2604869 RepID=A0A6B1F5L6_9SYNE|nr:DUF3727 domain-containing protein [Synechococcus sp. SB0668_bin_13]MYG38039.1 DUF3727 domain-containing protein [Synechococcus sp. SB0676_bin_10]MYK06916.1 DUF3727 domain-containing protein [Synechococcus sp. SB0670_bin_20]